MKKKKNTPTKKARYILGGYNFSSLNAAKRRFMGDEKIGKINSHDTIFKVVEEFDIEIKKVVTTKKVK